MIDMLTDTVTSTAEIGGDPGVVVLSSVAIHPRAATTRSDPARSALPTFQAMTEQPHN